MADDATATLTSLLAELTTAISTVTTYLKENNHPEPTLLKGTLPRVGAIFEARDAIKRTSAAIGILAEWSELEYVENQTVGLPYAFAPLHVAVSFGVAKAIKEDEEVDIAELCKRTGCQDQERLAAVMRLCAQNFIFRQPRDDVFAHNKFSLTLLDEPHAQLVLSANDFLYKAGPYVYQQISQYPNSIKPSHAAWAFSNGTPDKENFFEHLAKHPEDAAKFAGSLAAVGQGSMGVLKEVYPWASLGEKTVVDVGGSHGHIAIDLARVAPDAKFIVQDLPEVIEVAKTKSLPEDVASRITFETHDFYTPQPTSAEVYFLRFILHNHGDDRAVEIIKHLVPKLKPGRDGSGGRILVADTVISKTSAPPLGWSAQMMNFCMIALHNSGERTFEQSEALFKRADKRFRLRQYGANGPAASEVIEAWLEEE